MVCYLKPISIKQSKLILPIIYFIIFSVDSVLRYSYFEVIRESSHILFILIQVSTLSWIERKVKEKNLTDYFTFYNQIPQIKIRLLQHFSKICRMVLSKKRFHTSCTLKIYGWNHGKPTIFTLPDVIFSKKLLTFLWCIKDKMLKFFILVSL